MSVRKQDVYYMANLARLRISEEEAEVLQHDMNRILSYMDQLNEVDTREVAPLEHVSDSTARLRTDEALPPLDHELALKNAPDADADYFRVPKVIE